MLALRKGAPCSHVASGINLVCGLKASHILQLTSRRNMGLVACAHVRCSTCHQTREPCLARANYRATSFLIRRGVETHVLDPGHTWHVVITGPCPSKVQRSETEMIRQAACRS